MLGVKYGFQPGPRPLLYARNLLPADAQFTAPGVGRSAFAMLALSYLAGGHVRVGLEDSVYLAKGELAPSNASMGRKGALDRPGHGRPDSLRVRPRDEARNHKPSRGNPGLFENPMEAGTLNLFFALWS